MILITGGAGFIGSNIVNFFAENYVFKVVSVDYKNELNSVYFKKHDIVKIHPEKINSFLKNNLKEIVSVIHLGAITSTTEKNVQLIIKNNLELSLFLWKWCLKNKKRFIYASSAATYGDGSNNFNDLETSDYLSKLNPLNLYGWSKHLFDRFITKQKRNPVQCVGLKFFNVYGPNEFHKSHMRSIILKIFQTISKNNYVKLFKSHNPNYRDGEQMRDFIYIKDVVKIVNFFFENKNINGLFNVGTGIPRSFNDLANAVFKNTNKKNNIQYIATPKNIRDQYQYFTKANLTKLRKVGYKEPFFSLEDGIEDYIKNFLIKGA